MDNLTTEIKDAYNKAKSSKIISSIKDESIENQYKLSLSKINDIQKQYKNKEGVYGILTNEEHKKTKLIQEIKNVSDKFLFYLAPIIDDKYINVIEEELQMNKEIEDQSVREHTLIKTMDAGPLFAVDDGGLAKLLGGTKFHF